QFKATNKRVLVHAPCTEKNALKERGSVEQLLSHLPNTEIISLKESTGCCGAAGDYMINNASMANKIRLPLISDIETINPDIIVTSNYTCGIHIKNGLLEKNLDIPVLHPIRLLLKYISL
ncbi:MAG: (Fe-S)-binding protein, partial [Gammaproteobacteria bacterium]|nr:(Fe-S)-binding protein [Gammaproteobacteria bacterium]